MVKVTQKKEKPYPTKQVLVLLTVATILLASAVILGIMGNHLALHFETITSDKCNKLYNRYTGPANTIATLSALLMILTVIIQMGRSRPKRTAALSSLTVVFALVTLAIVNGSAGDRWFCGYQF